MQDFAKLRVGRQARALVVAVYRLTSTFPRGEQYGLTSQLRRAAVSVVCNLAEGAKRQSRTDYARFINMAEGSAAEVEALFGLCSDLSLVSSADAESLLAQVADIGRMLFRLRQAVEGYERREHPPRRAVGRA
jgi:four helix bundle protein